jgi:hypothetical protein
MFYSQAFILHALCSALFLSSSVLGSVIPEERNAERRQTTDYHWVDTWTSMPQLVEQSNLPPSPFVFSAFQIYYYGRLTNQ